MPSFTLLMTEHDYMKLIIHKALVEAANWDQYIQYACMPFPMRSRDYSDGFPFSEPPRMNNLKQVSIRMSDEVHAKANEIRRKLNFTWREFVMYPSQNDGIDSLIQQWTLSSRLNKVVIKGIRGMTADMVVIDDIGDDKDKAV